MNVGWATFWPSVAKIAVVIGAVWISADALNLIREIYVK